MVMNMKVNIPELAHYIVGGIGLILAWLPIMNYFNNVYIASIVWIGWYIFLDQMLHVLIKHEKIAIIR